MVKRQKTPPPAEDEPQYLTIVNPYPLCANWELSADRANAARRLMQANGIAVGQIAQVRGFADQMPRRPDRPEDPSNRRITVIVDSLLPPATAPPASPTSGKTEVATANTEGRGDEP